MGVGTFPIAIHHAYRKDSGRVIQDLVRWLRH